MAMSRGPALAVIEVSSIARGVVIADAALKQAPAVLLSSRAVSGGKHLVMLEGEVAVVEESFAVAVRVAAATLLDRVLLAQADGQVWPMLGAPVAAPDWSVDSASEAVLIVETQTVCAAVASADAACKVADVVVRDVRFAIDIAGKAYFTLTGSLSSIEAAREAVVAAAEQRLVAAELIAQPAPELRGALFR